MTLVSVVIPVYNAGQLLTATLAALLCQTFGGFEAVVVDDGSTDRSSRVILQFARTDARIRPVLQPNSGIACARNRGLAASDPGAPYVLFLDHDDVLAPGALATLVSVLEQRPDAAAAYGIARKVDIDGKPFDEGALEAHQRSRRGVRDGRLAMWPREADTTFSVLAFWNYIVTAGQVLVRREALAAAGPFDPSTVPADDWDMWLRLAQVGPFALVDQRVIDWRSHAGNTSGRRHTMDGATRRVRWKLLAMHGLSPEDRAIARQGHRYDALVKFGFAVEPLRRGRIREAASQVARASLAYGRYARACWTAAGSRRDNRQRAAADGHSGALPDPRAVAGCAAPDAVEPATFCVYTMVTDPEHYRAMRETFEEAGFREPCCRFVALQNVGGNRHDPYELLSEVAAHTPETYAIVCHQDIRLDQGHGALHLSGLLAQLDAVDPRWAVAGNAGYDELLRPRASVVSPDGVYHLGRPSMRVRTLSDPFVVVRTSAAVGCSPTLRGYHLYGTDLCLNAEAAGRTCYAVDFRVTHLSRGYAGDDFLRCAEGLKSTWHSRFGFRYLPGPGTPLFLSRHALLRAPFGLRRVAAFVVRHRAAHALATRLLGRTDRPETGARARWDA